jgi:hypothetical protein
MALTAGGVLPVATAFFTAAALMVLLGALSLREAYQAIDWPILVMLGALIPVSDTIRTTGAADLLAGWLSQLASMLPAYGALALIMVAAMAVTPFLNNAATVLVMAPIAATFAGQLDYKPDAFLMAVAVGAGCDFLTPIGHQCNTLVMGPGGYRFGDYWATLSSGSAGRRSAHSSRLAGGLSPGGLISSSTDACPVARRTGPRNTPMKPKARMPQEPKKLSSTGRLFALSMLLTSTNPGRNEDA